MTQLLKRPAVAAGHMRLPSRTPARVPSLAPVSPSSAPAASEAPAQDPAKLQAELDTLREAARREGYAQGLKRADQELQAALDQQQEALHSCIRAMEQALASKLTSVEPMSLAIAYEAAACVLGEAASDRDAVAAIVRRLVEAAAPAMKLRIALSQEQCQEVRAALAADPHGQHRSLEFEADPSLKAGDCRVITENGQLETGLEIQLQAIQRSLLEAHAQAVSREAVA